jgi:flagellar biosynthesis chaperone FliJ
MTQTAAPLRNVVTRPVTLPGALPGLPRGPMSPEQQLEALQKVQAQAEQRVKLGVQLFKAAEAHTSQHRAILDEVKAEQSRFRDELTQDVTRSLHAYDQWVGQIDDTISDSIKSLEDKMDKLTSDWAKTQQRIESMMKRSEALLDQSRCLVEGNSSPAARPAAPAAAPVPVAVAPAALESKITSAPIPEPEPASLTGEITPTTPGREPESPTLYSQVLAKLHERNDAPPAA